MTFAILAALTATFLSLPLAIAQQDDTRYTVWSSVIFTRTGERTPTFLGDIPTQLTTLGAQQQYQNGQFFRSRYLTSMGSTNGVDGAPISMMSPSIPDVRQVFVAALDQQYTIASAQAFMQGLYPPFQLVNNGSTQEEAQIDPLGMLANGTYIEAPLSGYQYTQINAYGAYDPDYPYVAGNMNCQGWDEAAIEYILTEQFTNTLVESSSIYEKIAPEFLPELPQVEDEQWSYVNAYAIYDWLNYQNMHNQTVMNYFNQSASDTGISYLDSLRHYADQQQFAQLGNLYATNNVTHAPWVEGVTGSISTISGNMLAAKMALLLETNILTAGQNNKFNLLVGDFQPLVSFFALMGLPAQNSDFYGLPDFASTAVFEMYSDTTGSEALTFPSVDELWVRFYFRNGTDDTYQAYSLFGLGPDQFEMRYGDFILAMQSYGIGNIGFWCQQCGPEFDESTRVFCSYWNTSNSLYDWGEPDGFGGSSWKHNLSPAVSGVIGAIVALGIAGLIFAAIMLIGGVRFHRVHSRKSELGGFKGSQKLASDRDLTLPKGGAIVGATVETPGSPVTGGHERVGSWELKQHDLPNIAATHPARRPSFEEDEEVDISNRKPVRPDERV